MSCCYQVGSSYLARAIGSLDSPVTVLDLSFNEIGFIFSVSPVLFSFLILFFSDLTLYHLFSSHLILSYLVSSYLIPPYLISSYLILSLLIWSDRFRATPFSPCGRSLVCCSYLLSLPIPNSIPNPIPIPISVIQRCCCEQAWMVLFFGFPTASKKTSPSDSWT